MKQSISIGITTLTLACLTLPFAFAGAQAGDAAWNAAQALKAKAAYPQAAAAFEAWSAANSDAPRFPEGLTEAGVCWFSDGRSKLVLLRNSPESDAAFGKALANFDRVLALGASPYSARAQYMRGSTKFFMDDMPGAEAEYTLVLDTWKADLKYVPKALEKRASVYRNRLDTQAALADLRRYAKEFPTGPEIESVKTYTQRALMFDKPAPPVTALSWIQGKPTSIAAERGEVVVLYFFATWCENCEKIRPFIIDLHKRYEPFNVRWIGIVDSSKGQTVESVRSFLVQNGIRFPVMMTDGSPARTYGASGIPDAVLIDRAGNLRWNDNPNNLMDSTIEALLLTEPTPPADK
ncbi:MAG: redoxin domain-containing protein [Planctomycetes bacterium]|nr:redoxin domain-containing protein [Planctomycetota bacterium]